MSIPKTYRVICKFKDGGRYFGEFNANGDHVARQRANERFEEDGNIESITILHNRRKVIGISRFYVR